MNKAGVLFVVIVLGYILFELSMLHRLGYRMEADYILEQMVPSAEAAALCGVPSARQQDAFAVKLERVVRRAVKERGEADPRANPGNHAAEVEAQLAALRAGVTALVDAEGCDGESVSTLLRRYTIYAGRS